MAQKGVTIAHTPFPLYSINTIGNKHFIVAGGGGQAKTGISNAINVYELVYQDGTCVANEVDTYETGSAAVMNSDACVVNEKTVHIATGQNEHCKLYNFKYDVVSKEIQNISGDSAQAGVRKRKKDTPQQNDKEKTSEKTIKFKIENIGQVQTDFSKDGPFQKVCRFSPDCKFLVTGGADGYVRVWKHPSLEKVHAIKAHTNEVDDVAVSPPGDRIASVSKDGNGFVWSMKDGKTVTGLVWSQKTDVKYRCRSCRYGIIEDSKTGDYCLFTTHIPVTRSSKPSPCYITKWETKTYKPKLIVGTGVEVTSALALSQRGTFLGLGTLNGSISVYISFNLQRLYHLASAHGIFVTGLEFASETSTTRTLTGGHEFTLFSISADNQIKIHQQPERTMYSAFWAVLGFIILIYLFFWGISAMGL